LVQGKDYAWRPNVQRLYEFLHLPTSQVSYYEQKEIERLEGWLFHKDVEWYEALNFVDFAAQTMWDGRISELAHVNLNEAFEREGSRLTAISRKYSLQLRTRRKLKKLYKAHAQGDRFSGAREHIVTALQFLGLRPEPDYRNAIKEAISAVEKHVESADHGQAP